MVRTRKRLKVASVDSTTLDEEGKRVLAMLTALETEDKLNNWEQTFVASVSDRFIGKGLSLTPKQFDRLAIIYATYY